MLFITLLVGLFINFTVGQAVFKCSPIDGTLDTYSYVSGSDNGIACVRGSGTANLIFYVEKMTPNGERKMAVGSAKFNKETGKHQGLLYRLYPPGPKQAFVAQTSQGFITIKFDNDHSIDLNLRPDGLPWIPADIRRISGCAMDTPQLLLDVVDPRTSQHGKTLLCAMTHSPGNGYDAVYGFGLRTGPLVGMEPFFFLGQTLNPITPSGPINIVANTMDICLKPDCTQCTAGLKSLTLS